jgi:hypothetical protein
MIRGLARARFAVLLTAIAAAGCQKPTDPSDTISYDEVVVLAATPNPISFEFITLNATGNQLGGTNQPVSLSYEVWYDLPSLRKEAVVTMAVSFVDNDGTTFQKSVDFTVAP